MPTIVHSLGYIAKHVLEHGNLYYFGVFAFEPYLYRVKQMIKGTKELSSQIYRSCMKRR